MNIFKLLKTSCISLLTVVLMVAFSACSDEDDRIVGELNFDNPTSTVSAAKGNVTINVLANNQWKIAKFDKQPTWLKLSPLEGDRNSSFDISYDENIDIKARKVDITVVTLDGRGFKTLNFIQLPSTPIIELEEDEIDVKSRAGRYAVKGETNIPLEVLTIQSTYEVEPAEDWIINTKFEDGVLTFNTRANPENEARTASITLSYEDENVEGAEAWAILTVTQKGKGNDIPPELIDMTAAQALPYEVISNYISVKGFIVVDPKYKNFRDKTYVLQGADNKSIVFESDDDIGVDRHGEVELILEGAEIMEIMQNGDKLKIFKGLSSANIFQKIDGTQFTPLQLGIDELTEEHLHTVVTLKDVEVSIPFGGYTNLHEHYVTEAEKEDKPNLNYRMAVRHYPHSIRDIHGGSMYMITNKEVPYRRKTIPQGSGTITGLVVRELDSHYGNLGKFSIRQQAEEDVVLNKSRNSGFSKVLLEWDCTKPAQFTEGMQKIGPKIGDAAANLTTQNAKGFFSGSGDGKIYFADGYRSDISLTGPSIVKTSTYVVAGWNVGNYWLIEGVSTLGITKPISIQFEANSFAPTGPRDFAIEYSIDKGNTWTQIATYMARGQITSALYNQNHIAGHKMYNYNLPADALGVDELQIRLRNTNQINMAGNEGLTAGGTVRMAHVSLKHNK